MKKTLIILFSILFLVGCQKETSQISKSYLKIEKEVDEKKTKWEYIEEDDLKYLIRESNKTTNIIEIETLHDLIIINLEVQVDLDIPIEDQIDLIENIVTNTLNDWKRVIVEQVISDNRLDVNDDDLETILQGTSIVDAARLMTVYEVIYLKKLNN